MPAIKSEYRRAKKAVADGYFPPLEIRSRVGPWIIELWIDYLLLFIGYWLFDDLTLAGQITNNQLIMTKSIATRQP
jgi:hypothetical protein